MMVEKRQMDADRSLVSRAKTVFSNSKIQALRNLKVEPHERGVIVLGQVPLFYYKQLAQELVRNKLDDHVSIINRIEVIESH